MSNCIVNKNCGNWWIYTSRKCKKDVFISNSFFYKFCLFSNKTWNFPIFFTFTNVKYKIFQNLCSTFRMDYFWMKLKCINSVVICNCSNWWIGFCNYFKIFWQFCDVVIVAHPDVRRFFDSYEQWIIIVFYFQYRLSKFSRISLFNFSAIQMCN